MKVVSSEVKTTETHHYRKWMEGGCEIKIEYIVPNKEKKATLLAKNLHSIVAMYLDADQLLELGKACIEMSGIVQDKSGG